MAGRDGQGRGSAMWSHHCQQGAGLKGLFLFPAAVRGNVDVERWLASQDDVLGSLARRWFDVMRDCGPDVRELLHDGYPTACVDDAAFGYVGVFKAHVNVGFFRGAELADPAGLLQGTGKLMRHVKLRPGEALDPQALEALIREAYADMHRRLRSA